MSDYQQWFYIDQSFKEAGPINSDELQAKVDSGEITRSTYVWTQELEEWMPSYSIEGLYPPEVQTMVKPLKNVDFNKKTGSFSLDLTKKDIAEVTSEVSKTEQKPVSEKITFKPHSSFTPATSRLDSTAAAQPAQPAHLPKPQQSNPYEVPISRASPVNNHVEPNVATTSQQQAPQQPATVVTSTTQQLNTRHISAPVAPPKLQVQSATQATSAKLNPSTGSNALQVPLGTTPVSVNHLTARVDYYNPPSIPAISTKTEDQNTRANTEPVVVSIPKPMQRD